MNIALLHDGGIRYAPNLYGEYSSKQTRRYYWTKQANRDQRGWLQFLKGQ